MLCLRTINSILHLSVISFEKLWFATNVELLGICL